MRQIKRHEGTPVIESQEICPHSICLHTPANPIDEYFSVLVPAGMTHRLGIGSDLRHGGVHHDVKTIAQG